MNQALLTGVFTAIDHWWITFRANQRFLLLVLLLTFIQGLIIFECLTVLDHALELGLYHASGFLETAFMGEQTHETRFLAQLSNYFQIVWTKTTGTLVVLNSFLIGIYYSRKKLETVESSVHIEDVLDSTVPENVVVEMTVGAVLEHIDEEGWRTYFVALCWWMVISFGFDLFSNFMMPNLHVFLMTLSYLIYGKVVYFLLIKMYWRQQNLSSVKDIDDWDPLPFYFFLLIAVPSVLKILEFFV